MNKPKMLILEDCEIMLQNLQMAITKYEVLPAQTLEEALRLVETKEISFIVTDIRLKGTDRGYQLFERLFSNGKLIPGIIMTAFVVTPAMQEELSRIGVTDWIQKGVSVDLSDALENAADEILTDKKKQLIQLTNKAKGFGLMDKPLGHGRGSVRDCLNSIWEGKCPNENEIIDLIIKACNRLGRPDDRDLPPGHTVGHLPD